MNSKNLASKIRRINEVKKDIGTINALSLIKVRLFRKFLHFIYSPAWYIFKLKNINFKYEVPAGRSTIDSSQGRENSIRTLISKNSWGKFLEIGIGEFPNIERINIMNSGNISYTGCDFKSVCDSHQKELEIKGINPNNIRYLSNTTGTYAWQLFELLKNNEQFDVIYVDGHHTFYIDLPAMVLADQLLKPGGYLLLDDIEWSLALLKNNMLNHIGQWYFYRKIYNFADYTEEQQSLCHIEMLATELMIKKYGYSMDKEFSFPDWFALRKPE